MVAAVVYGFSFNKTKGKTMRIFNCGRKYVEGHLVEILADEGLFVVSLNGFCVGEGRVVENEVSPISQDKGVILYFDDASPDDIGKPGIVKIFDRKMALSVFEAVEAAFKAGKERLLVHCGAGISRSAAISAVLNDFVNVVLSDNKADRAYNAAHGFEFPPVPNPHVMSVMRRVLAEEILPQK